LRIFLSQKTPYGKTNFWIVFLLSQKEPELLSISFLSKDNSMQLVEDVKGEIIGDSAVECWVRNIMSDKPSVLPWQEDFHHQLGQMQYADRIIVSRVT
jgi:hypothetical protein